MGKIVLAVKGKTADSLTSKDLELIKHTLPEAMELWHKASNGKFDANLYDLNEDKVKMLRATIKNEQNALVNLQQAMIGRTGN